MIFHPAMTAGSDAIAIAAWSAELGVVSGTADAHADAKAPTD